MAAPRGRPSPSDGPTPAGPLLAGAALLLAARAAAHHPLLVIAIPTMSTLAAVVTARIRDRLAARAHDPAGPGVVIGTVRAPHLLARPRPFRIPWSSFHQHVLIDGPTGRGKSFTFVSPFLCAHLARPRTGVFYLDGKGDPVDARFDAVFIPQEPDGSAHWNPLASPDPTQAAALFAAALFPEAARADSPGSFYAARAVFAITKVAPAMAHTGLGTAKEPLPTTARTDAPSLLAELVAHGVEDSSARALVERHDAARIRRQLDYLEHRPPEQRTPTAIAQAIERDHAPPKGARRHALFAVTPADLNAVLFDEGRLRDLAQALQARIARCAPDQQQLRIALAQLEHDVSALSRLPAREHAQVFQSLQNRLGWFLEPPFLELCSRTDMDVADVTRGARLGFLLPTGRFPNAAAPLGRVALSQFKNAVLASPPGDGIAKVAILEEFHNFVSDDFAAFLNQARSRGGAAIMAMQSIEDFPRDTARAMLANISTSIVTPGCKPADSEYWAEVFGKAPTERRAYSWADGSWLERTRATVRVETAEEFRYTPTAIAELDPDHALIQVTCGRRTFPAAIVDVGRTARPWSPRTIATRAVGSRRASGSRHGSRRNEQRAP
jgi:type IV secretory pathway TraG/TraD family ATPase VirD4